MCHMFMVKYVKCHIKADMAIAQGKNTVKLPMTHMQCMSSSWFFSFWLQFIVHNVVYQMSCKSVSCHETFLSPFEYSVIVDLVNQDTENMFHLVLTSLLLVNTYV